ncbi:MAG TPA: DNA cytosine methyltransferase [Beijerinckiaceae bacterium]|jgi:DNA (cytosine-5)-methyltransferase 1
MALSERTFYEFFAGGGMARAGLGPSWRCLFANDFDHKKGAAYQANWGDGEMRVVDVRTLQADDVPGRADLAWASFPCQDLSLAGGGAGLKGERSGTFYPFWALIDALADDGRAPSIVALENVNGTLTSHGGKDFAAIGETFVRAGYRFGAVVIDAALFVPQSRPRLFVIGVRADLDLPDGMATDTPSLLWHPKGLRAAYGKLPARARRAWVWWNFPAPAMRNTVFADLIEEDATVATWHSPEETARILATMTPVNREKVAEAERAGRRVVGSVYRRTRKDEHGVKRVRAEVRFDDVSGCLRTPAGGSSRQVIMIVDGAHVRTRLITARETARLMGLPDDYVLPKNYNEAYHLTGDGVAVPVVRHLAANLIEPILDALKVDSRQAA